MQENKIINEKLYTNKIIEYIIKKKKNIDFKIDSKTELNYDNFSKIARKNQLICEKITKNKYKKIENVLLPAIAKLNDKYYLLLQINRKNDKLTYILNDLTNKKNPFEIKDIPNEIYLFLNNEENEILSSDNEWFIDIIKSEKKSYFKILYISIFINFFILIIPLYMMSIYDRVIPSEGYASLISLTIGVVMIFSFDLIFKYVRTNIINDINSKISRKIEETLMNKILNIKKQYDKHSIGNKFNLFREMSIIKDFFSSNTMIIFLELPFFIIGLLFIELLSENLIYIPIVISIIMFSSNYIVQLKLNKIYNTLHLKEQNKNDFIIESILNKEDIINNNQLDNKIYESHRILEEQEYISKELLSLKSHFGTFLQTLVQMTTIAIMFFGVFEVIDNKMSIGYLIALSILSSRVMMPIMNLNMNYLKYNDVVKSFKVINNFLKLPEHNETNKLIVEKVEGAFKIERLDFKYNQNFIFEKLNLKINKGDKIAIIGEIGIGKTTLLNILIGKLIPSNGAVYIDNHNLININKELFNTHIGFMGENCNIFKGTMYDNINIQKKYTQEEIIEKIEKFKLTKLMGLNKEVFSIPIEERGKNLSNGQKQVINFLRMIISEPKILILDEPTQFLDPGKENIIKKFLFEYCKDKTLILSTNKIHMLEIVQQINIIGGNKIDKSVSVQEFFKGKK